VPQCSYGLALGQTVDLGSCDGVTAAETQNHTASRRDARQTSVGDVS